MDLHVFPIPIPPPTSLSTQFLWVFPVHQARALVSCIQPGLMICFTRIHIFNLSSFSSFLFKDTLSPSRTSSDITPCKSSTSCHQIKDVCGNLGPLSKHSYSLPRTTMLGWEHASWRPLDTQEGFQVQQANTWSFPGFPSISIWSGAQMENPGVPLDHSVSQIMPNPSANPLGSIIDRCMNSNHSHHWPPPPFAQNLPGLSTSLGGFQPLQHGDLVLEHSSPNSCIMPSHLLQLFTQRPSPR